MQTANLKIDGMSCQNCVAHVSRAIAAVPGARVEEVTVGAATVSLEPAREKEIEEKLIHALAEAGYPATWASTPRGS